MKRLILIFAAFAICLATGTEKLAFNWNGFSNPFLSNAFPSLHRSAEKVRNLINNQRIKTINISRNDKQSLNIIETFIDVTGF